MNHRWHARFWTHTLRVAALAIAVTGLAGCVAGYSYVQPGYGGGYYTGDTAYPAGYGDGYYGGYYGGYGYGSTVSIGIGYGGYGWPGYYGGYGYGYYPGYYDHRHRGNWHGHSSWSGHGGDGTHSWAHPTTAMPTPTSRGFARPAARPAPVMHAPSMRFGAPSHKRR